MYSDSSVTNQSIILDPMCGKGSILNELKNCIIIGSDNDPKQLSFATENVKNVNMILADARYLPIKSRSIDHILCDIPFGIQYSSQSELEHLLPSVIKEMKRIIKPKGLIILLISVEQFTSLGNVIKNDWTLKNSFRLSLGLLEAIICVYTFD
jgi:tRNA G10  N-methylase Trm11